MSKLTIVFNKDYPMNIHVFDAETGKPFLGITAFHLIATSRGLEAKIITDNEVLVEDDLTVEGQCIVPVTEQLALTHSDEFTALLAKLVARELTTQLAKAMRHDEEFFRKLRAWRDELYDKEEALVFRVIDGLKMRGVIS